MKHLMRGDLVKLLHHGARHAESDRKSEERHFGRILGSHKSVRDGLLTQIEHLTNNAFA